MLKTNCNKCIFLKDTACELNKETVLNNRSVVTEGYCNQKRSEAWLQQYKDQARPILEIINQDENNISGIITCKNKTKSEIIKTIKSCLKSPYIKQIVLSGYRLDVEVIKELINFLSDKGIRWSIDNHIEEFEDDLYFIDTAAHKATENWCLVADAGDEIVSEHVNILRTTIENKNIVFAYLENKLAFNKFAFVEMEGNLELPWIDKIRTFENWENTCLVIEK